jgi:EAL domain-containing protein (putative c-di-GMP-specific phosphodiesterase class I)
MRDQVRIAVDDAGAGFASLRHIVELAPAMVKLDRSLVARIADDPARRAVVDGMVKFAQTSDLILIAEGIENAAELATLRELGVPLGQGFLLGRPVAPPVAPLTATEPRATARSDQAAARRAARSRAKTATKAR